MNKLKNILVYTLAILYVIVFPIITLKILNYFMLNSMLNIALGMLFLVLVIFNTLTVFKLLVNYDRDGKLTNPFRKIKIYSDNELIIAEMNNLKTYQKTLIIGNNLIIINEAGFFEFVTLNKIGTLKGDINDDEWTINDKKIKNPFIIKENIYHYFIIRGNLAFKVTGVWLTTRSLIYNTMDKRLNKRIYDAKKIDEIYDSLKVKYGNNQN